MTSRPMCSPPSATGSPGSWSKPANTCPAPTTAPAATPIMSLTPSPACQPCSNTCHYRRHREHPLDFEPDSRDGAAGELTVASEEGDDDVLVIFRPNKS